MKKFFLFTIKAVLYIFAIFIVMLAFVFFAVRFGWTDVAGDIDENSEEYNSLATENRAIGGLLAEENILKKSDTSTSTKFVLPENESIYGIHEQEIWCKILVVKDFNAYQAKIILHTFLNTHSEILFNNMLLAFKLRIANGLFDQRIESCQEKQAEILLTNLQTEIEFASGSNIFAWQNGEAWQIIREALIKDKETIDDVAEKVGIQSRLLVSVAIVEQLRLYYTQRELFEKVFKPLKILANANKMAWGVMAIKEKTAILVEEHLLDQNSPYYLGTSSAHLLDYASGVDMAKERYQRLTNEKSHYYSYLYGALIIQQLEAQWERAGHSIEYRPELVATLFNIGFNNSKPKADPQVGGSTIEIEGVKYYFGSLAFEFYYSGEMAEYFSYK